MIQFKTSEEIDAIGEAGRIIGKLLEELSRQVAPGVTTGQLDDFAEELIRSHKGALPAFKGLYGFPAALCTSVNEEVVHGIPSRKRILEEGDVLTVDVGVKLDGWFADAARTYPVGNISGELQRLLDVTRQALDRGIELARPGNRLGDVGHAIQQVGEGAGFSVVRDLVGHGIGRSAHEEPQVPNFGRPATGPRIRAGLVVAIEPMFSAGSALVETLADGWTVVTRDRSGSAHFEHTVAVTDDGPRILTVA